MTAALEVVVPGIHTTLQDGGRRGFQDAGVPVSGPLDRIGLSLANALVGNAPGTPALEMILQGPCFEVTTDAVRVALAGCNGVIEVSGARARSVEAGRSARLLRGERFRVAHLGDAGCGYLAVEGGFDLPPCLGSASTYVRARLGGFGGRALQPGDRLPLRLATALARPEKRLAERFDLALDQAIRVVPGPQAHFFTEAAMACFLAGEYLVSAQSDRMGFRLDGPPLAHAQGYNIVSDGIVCGSIQVPGSGLPIVLMADAQTTGGYPKIATVISADIPVLGRRRPGRALRFAAVGVSEAEGLRRAQEAALHRSLATLRSVDAQVSIDVASLYTESLISGVASATE